MLGRTAGSKPHSRDCRLPGSTILPAGPGNETRHSELSLHPWVVDILGHQSLTHTQVWGWTFALLLMDKTQAQGLSDLPVVG